MHRLTRLIAVAATVAAVLVPSTPSHADTCTRQVGVVLFSGNEPAINIEEVNISHPPITYPCPGPQDQPVATPIGVVTSNGLRNGQRGVVEAITAERGVVVRLGDGTQATATARYLAAGHLDHGYALTVHKAQGMTTGRAFLLGNDALYREAGYVGLSRGRSDNRLYAVTAELAEERADVEHGPDRLAPDRSARLAALHDALVQSRAQQLAHSHATQLTDDRHAPTTATWASPVANPMHATTCPTAASAGSRVTTASTSATSDDSAPPPRRPAHRLPLRQP